MARVVGTSGRGGRLEWYGTARKTNNAIGAGAVEFAGGGGGGTAVLSVSGGPVAFGNGRTGTHSPSQALPLHNTGSAQGTGIAVAGATASTPTTPNQFARLGGTCGATLNAGATCTITITFSPTSTGAKTGTVTITANVAVSGSPVGLTGTGVTPVIAAGLSSQAATPPWSATRGCTIGLFGTCPMRGFVLTNTGNVTLTGITQGVLGGVDASEFTVLRVLSSCGPAGGGQLLGPTTLAAGAACAITVPCLPLT